MHTPKREYKPGEITDLGWDWYNRTIRAKMTQADIGKLVLIDVETGDYEVTPDEESIAASDRLRVKNPGTMLCRIRVGFKTVASFKGIPLPPDPL